MLGDLVAALASLPEQERIEALNRCRAALHEISPFRHEPVDCVLWVPAGSVRANTYNPNTVAPPEMELLCTSIRADGYTQPVVTWRDDDAFEVVDGFHRTRVGKECSDVCDRVHGHLPVVAVNSERGRPSDRMAATIRHNRARGVHGVAAMSAIVVELHRKGWSDEKIAKELGMQPDEVLRLKQTTGLAEMFAHRDFSEAWDVSPREA